MQPSEYEIKREVEALRDIRRRSTAQGGPGALMIDPDLPAQSSPPSPTASYWGATPNLTDGGSATSSLEDGSSVDQNPNNPTDDPFHLFWVPASVHPEIAPAEFRAFLKEHATSDGTTNLARSSSTASTSSLARKKSMLSRQYRPSENDEIENEQIVPLRRNRSIYTNSGPQLTISDLQKLDLLAEEASQSDDPSKLRSILRRSLSLNVSPTVLDTMDDMPDMEDEADAPIIVPPPGQILRRAARTKIRKPGLQGDGGGHRFGPSRRRPATAPDGTAPPLQRSSTSSSSSEHGDSVESLPRPRAFSNESLDAEAARGLARPDSYSEETSIYDAYARDEDDSEEISLMITSPPPMTVDLPISLPPPEPEPVVEPLPPPVLHHPQPQRLLVPPPQPRRQVTRTPSPEDPFAANPSRSPTQEIPAFLSSPPSPSQQRKDKDKKGLFGKWGGDKSGKKSANHKERENRERAEKEKEGGFLSSFFSSKKKQEDPPASLAHSPTAGREAAQALLGASKSSKSYVSPSSPQSGGGLTNPYARYPIHVERAIYRLSHIKLANPRRPLYEQVLISNLMFWYLGVINKAQTPTTSPTSSGAVPTAQPTPTTVVDKEQKEREQREKEERQKAEMEKLEMDREMEQKKKEPHRRGSLTKTLSTGTMPGGRRAEMPVRGPQYEMQHRVIEQEYNGFNNGPSGFNGQPGYNGQSGYNGQPVFIGQPGYNAQPVFNAQSVFNGQAGFDRRQGYIAQPDFDREPSNQSMPMGRTVSAPANPGSVQLPQYPQIQQPGVPPTVNMGELQPRQLQPRLQASVPNNFYYGEQQPRPGPPTLPPGAMAPVPNEQAAWLSSPPPAFPRKNSSPPLLATANPLAPQRRRSPPPPNRPNLTPNRYTEEPIPNAQGGLKAPSRSLSATSPASPVINGKPRKGISAHATPKGRRPRTADGAVIGEEEDVPLAVWQQQRRR